MAWCVAPLAVKACGCPVYVICLARFSGEVAVAAQCDVVAADGNDSVQHIVLGGCLGQYYVMFLDMGKFLQHSFVSPIFEQWANARPIHMQCHAMSLVEQLLYLWYYDVVWNGFLVVGDIGVLHNC